MRGHWSAISSAPTGTHRRNYEIAAEAFEDVLDALLRFLLPAEAEESFALEPKQMFHVPGYSPHLARAVALLRAVDAEASEEERAAARELVGEPVRMSPLPQALLIDQLQRSKKWLAPGIM